LLKRQKNACRLIETRWKDSAALFGFQNNPGIGKSWDIGEYHMDVMKVLAELRQEREQIEEAILTLERLARGRGRRRGRPPAWMTELKRRGRPPGSKNKAKEGATA
jgi:hypothetical protein